MMVCGHDDCFSCPYPDCINAAAATLAERKEGTALDRELAVSDKYQRQRAYYAAHKDEIAARQRAYREAHKDEIAAQKRAYYAAHKDEIAAQKRAYYATHKDEIAAKRRAKRAERKQTIEEGLCISELC